MLNHFGVENATVSKAEAKALVLVGTYRRNEGHLDWINKRRIYNYPLSKEEVSQPNSNWSKISELWLYSGKNDDRHIYSAEFLGIKSREDFLTEYPDYPKGKKKHGDFYAIFKIAFEYEVQDSNAPAVVRVKDFASHAPEIVEAIKLYNESCKLGSLLDYLPKELPALSKDKLNLCELAMQMSFWDLPETNDFKLSIPFPAPTNPKFTFIDLFAGIGGFRLAMQACGGKCVFSSEFDPAAQKTYFHNFGEIPYGDITLRETKQAIPSSFDCLFGGFPCQPFSIAGYRKGFSDTRGTLFYDIAEIIKSRRPKAVFLENVKNLKTHDGGNTFKVIKSTLEELGYVVYDKVMNAMEYANIPQNRERIFIVCFDPKQVPNYSAFNFPEKQELKKSVRECIKDNEYDLRLIYTSKMSHYDELVSNITDEDSVYQWRRQYVRKNMSHVCPTLTANMGTGGHNVPLIVRNGNIRKLSPKECLNFQGFPEEYNFPEIIPLSSMYKQAGNSVVVPLIQAVCAEIVKVLNG